MTTAMQHYYTHAVLQVSRKYGLTVARQATVVVAVPSTIHYPANYKINIYLIYCLKYFLTKQSLTKTLRVVIEYICTEGDSNGKNSSYGPVFTRFTGCIVGCRSRGSSVSMVSGYGMDDREIEVRSRQRQEIFFSNLCVQIGSVAHPASCTMGTGVLSPGVKARPGRDADHSPPSSAEVVNE
jgi:hypothetical protein